MNRIFYKFQVRLYLSEELVVVVVMVELGGDGVRSKEQKKSGKKDKALGEIYVRSRLL